MTVKITSFILLTSFYAVYFFKQFSSRNKGIRTNRLAKGSKPKRTRIIEACLLISTYVTAGMQYLSVLSSRNIGALPASRALSAVGLVMMAAGVIFFLLSVTAMGDNWRAGIDETQKTNIVTSGIYKHSRNPAFAGFDLLYIGSALALPNILLIVAVIVSIALMHLQILEEEKYLPLVFGPEYVEYKKRTPRYLLFF